MKNKLKKETEFDELLENNKNKKNALKKIIKELDKNENTKSKSN